MNELEYAIRANQSLIYAVSIEEDRFSQELEQVAISLRRQFWIYTISEGLRNMAFFKTGELCPVKRDKPPQNPRKDPVEMLEYLKTVPVDSGIFLLLDFDEMMNNAFVRRHLKDVARRFNKSHNTVVVLANSLMLPDTLAHDTFVYDYPLPSTQILQKEFNIAVSELSKRPKTVGISSYEKETLISQAAGLTTHQFLNALRSGIVKNKGVLDGSVFGEINETKRQMINKTRILEYLDTDETFEKVGGLERLKTWFYKRRNAYSKEAEDYGLPSPKGVLLTGVSGCGKSLAAKASAALWGFPLLRLDTGRLFSSRVGSSEENLRQVIKTIKAVSPAVLWIDELEKAVSGISGSGDSDAGTAARVFALLATWLQEKNEPVFLVATANAVDSVPPEMLRKGRWDEIFFLDLPNYKERESIIKIHLKKRHRYHDSFDIPLLAKNAKGYSGAEIESAITAGMFDAFDNERPLTTGDILTNLKIQQPLSATLSNYLEYLRQWASTCAVLASETDEKSQKERGYHGNIRQFRMADHS